MKKSELILNGKNINYFLPFFNRSVPLAYKHKYIGSLIPYVQFSFTSNIIFLVPNKKHFLDFPVDLNNQQIISHHPKHRASEEMLCQTKKESCFAWLRNSNCCSDVVFTLWNDDGITCGILVMNWKMTAAVLNFS